MVTTAWSIARAITMATVIAIVTTTTTTIMIATITRVKAASKFAD